MEGETAAVPPVKRRRGRPRKTEAPVTPAGDSAREAVTPAKGADGVKVRKQRKRKGEVPTVSSVDVSMIGQQVTGVLDGTFDAGYLLSVRVGSTDTILRGVVFGPGLSVPISKVNDVAPGVKHVRREEKAIPPAPKPVVTSSLPFVSTQTVLPPPSSIPPTSAVLEAAAAVFGNSVSASSAAPTTGLAAALQQLPGGGYTPDAATFSHAAFQTDSVKQVQVNVQSGA